MTRKTLRLLLSLVKDNRRVKAQLFYSINVLLEVKCAVKHLTELLKEVRANIGLSNICVYRASLAVFKLLPTVHVDALSPAWKLPVGVLEERCSVLEGSDSAYRENISTDHSAPRSSSQSAAGDVTHHSLI